MQSYGTEQANWEAVGEDSHSGRRVSRLQVPGGWLYLVETQADGQVLLQNVVYVPRPSGEALSPSTAF